MLNKRACQNCSINNEHSRWCIVDEKLWDRGIVWCGCADDATTVIIIDIKRQPPKRCPFQLEHFTLEHPC